MSRSTKIWREDVAGDFDGLHAAFEGFAEGVVFDFDAEGAGVADAHEFGHEGGPVDVAVAGDAGLVPVEGEVEAADLVEGGAVDFDVFGVDVEELGFELGERAERVHVL